jgi:pyruvate formate lyase activating enzyme
MHHASLYTKKENKKAVCRVCMRRCTISPGERGWCETRLNKGGKVFSLIYGRVSSMMVSPIEKKPLYHFYPGSLWLSVGSVGCNFKCPGCQNWEIAHAVPDMKGGYACAGEESIGMTESITPEILVEIASRERVKGISFTYNEPTLWVEYAKRCMDLAKKAGLLTNWVTNGYLTSAALDMIGPVLDSFRVDIKGFSSKTYKKIAGVSNYEEILEIVKRAKYRWKAHVEVVTNVIDGVNDDRAELAELIRWIRSELGPETPWHITRFFGHHRWAQKKTTPIETLEGIHLLAKEEGLLFPSLGNVAGHPLENTVCPSCGKTLIERKGIGPVVIHLVGNSCPHCGARIFGRFEDSE